MKRKHPNIINIKDVEPRVESRGEKFAFRGKRLGPQVGARAIGSSYFEIEPGRQAFPNHYHTANEEALFVIEGSGIVRIGGETMTLEVGDYVAFPVGPEHSHSIENNSSSVLKLLCISTLIPVEVVGYPDSKKKGIFAGPDATKGMIGGTTPWVRLMIRDQDSVDYYDGESQDV